MVTFPVPATSNRAGGFPALGFPVCFAPRVMRPIMPGALSALSGEPGNQPEFVIEPAPTPPLPAEAFSVSGAHEQSPKPSGRFSLRLAVYPPLSQVSQTDGCLYHLTPASRVAGGSTDSRVPLLDGHYSVSSLVRTPPPPSPFGPTSRGRRLYGLPCSAAFASGGGGLLQLLSASWSPCCR